VWLGILMVRGLNGRGQMDVVGLFNGCGNGVVIFFKGGCGQAKKASTESGQHFNVRFGGIILS
jgi:hypothetical protein